MLITKSDELKDLCELLSNEPFIAVDTEFVRVSTYYPIFSLLQISGETLTFAVDMQSDIDISPLINFFKNSKVRKVIHSARQDVEILLQRFGFIPDNLFDTQVAAQFLGYENPPSYDTLVRNLLGLELDKKMQFSAWQLRPLSSEQVSYALLDVIYLREIYKIIEQDLTESHKINWVIEECDDLFKEHNVRQTDEDLMKKFSAFYKNEEDFIKLYIAVLGRENIAKKENRVRARVMSDRDVVEASRSLDYKAMLSEDKIVYVRELAVKLLANKAKRSMKNEVLFDKLRKGLHEVSKSHGIASSMMARTDELVKISSGVTQNMRQYKGWRKEVFGDLALKILAANND